MPDERRYVSSPHCAAVHAALVAAEFSHNLAADLLDAAIREAIREYLMESGPPVGDYKPLDSWRIV